MNHRGRISSGNVYVWRFALVRASFALIMTKCECRIFKAYTESFRHNHCHLYCCFFFRWFSISLTHSLACSFSIHAFGTHGTSACRTTHNSVYSESVIGAFTDSTEIYRFSSFFFPTPSIYYYYYFVCGILEPCVVDGLIQLWCGLHSVQSH